MLRKCAKHRIQPAKNRVASLLLALDQIDGQTSPGAVARTDCNEFTDPAATLTSD